MQLFYATDFTAPEYMLSEEESRHAVKVLRLVEGDTLHITDGRGSLYRCEVVSPSTKRNTLTAWRDSSSESIYSGAVKSVA